MSFETALAKALERDHVAAQWLFKICHGYAPVGCYEQVTRELVSHGYLYKKGADAWIRGAYDAV